MIGKDSILSEHDIMSQICDLHNRVKYLCKQCKALNNGGGDGVWSFRFSNFWIGPVTRIVCFTSTTCCTYCLSCSCDKQGLYPP